MSHPVRITLLVAIWLLAWGEVSVANVVTGLVIAAGLLVLFPPTVGVGSPGSRPLRPIAFVRLLAYVLVQLVTANVVVAREILRRRAEIHSGVIAHPVPGASDRVLTVIANIIALSPGTMTVDVTHDPAVVHVHFLLLEDEAGAHRSIDRLAVLVTAAFGDARTPSPETTR